MNSAAFVPAIAPTSASSSSSASAFLGARHIAPAPARVFTTAPARAAHVNMQFGDLIKKVSGAAKDVAQSAGEAAKSAGDAAKSAAQRQPVSSQKVVPGMAVPQPGEPGYVAPPPSTASIFSDSPPKKEKKETVSKDTKVDADGEKKLRGVDLLRDDLLRNAPQQIGVGRQDYTFTYAPQAGEPGYVQTARDQAPVSELSVSTFADDKNYVSNVGGIEAVEKAAEAVLLKMKAEKEMKKANVMPVSDAETFDIPDYLKPIPEDFAGRRSSWKNY